MTTPKPLGVLVLVLGLAATASVAEARPRPAGKHHKSNFEANKTFGLGLMFGDPTGLSGKYFLSSDTALDFGIGGAGWAHRYYGTGLQVHVDHLWHPISLASAEPFELPLYFGIGGRLLTFDYDERPDRRYDNVTALGVRVPVGLAFDFNNVPLDIFAELAIIVDFFVNDYYHRAGIDGNGAIGIRYYFN